MLHNAEALLKVAGITTPIIGFYDVPDPSPFKPFAEPAHCLFSCFPNWVAGESVRISKDAFQCMGAGYWLCGVESLSRDKFVHFLADKEGLKSSPEIMNHWLDNQKPYQMEFSHIVIGPLKADQYEYLKTATFFVNPDQLSLLITGVEYHNALPQNGKVISRFGSGCSQLAALFDDLDQPQAIIGATDIAMRQYLPPSIMTLTVTKPMFRQLCELDENSFLYKPFWEKLRKERRKESSLQLNDTMA